MRRFYTLFSKSQTLSGQLTWFHYIELLKLIDINSINYYIEISIKFNLGYRQLRERIKNNEFERLSNETKEKLINKEELKVDDLVKNPIVINNPNNIEIIHEKVLQKLILEDISSFLDELGSGFSFIKNEYKIKLGDVYNYIDNNLKLVTQDKTIGIIICKKDNKYIMEYCSDKRILSKEYKITTSIF